MSHCKVVRACRRGCLARRRRVYQRTTHPHPPLAFTDFFASLFALPVFALPTSTDAAHPPPHPPPLRLPSRHRRIADACRLAHTTLHPPRRVAGPRRPPPPPLPASTHAVASRTDPRCKPPYLTPFFSESALWQSLLLSPKTPPLRWVDARLWFVTLSSRQLSVLVGCRAVVVVSAQNPVLRVVGGTLPRHQLSQIRSCRIRKQFIIPRHSTTVPSY